MDFSLRNKQNRFIIHYIDMQEIIVYIIIASLALYIGFKMYKSFTKKTNATSCGGCTGCDIEGSTSCN